MGVRHPARVSLRLAGPGVRHDLLVDCPPDPRPGARRRPTSVVAALALTALATTGLTGAEPAQAVTYSPPVPLLTGSPLTDADGVDAVGGTTYVYDGLARKLFKLDSGGLVAATADLSASVASGSSAVLSASAADIAVGAAKVYIADTGNHRVVSVPLLTTGTTTPALTLEMGTGTAGGTFDNTVANSQLSSPRGLTVTTSGGTDVLYVADTGHHQVIQRSGTALSIAAGNGQAPPPTAGSTGLSSPEDVAVDPAGVLYVSDTGYGRVVSVAPSRQLTTVASITAPGPLAASASTLAVGSSSGIKAVAVPSGAVSDLAPGTTASGIDIAAGGVVVATQAAGPSSKVLTISPTAAPDAAPVISGPTALSAAKGSTLSVPFTATGSPAPTWSLLESSTGAPALTIDPATGVLSGTLGASGTFTYRVQASNTLGRPNQVLTLTVGSVPATISAKPTAVAAQGSATVTWTAPTTSTAAAEAVTGYVLTPYAGGAAGTPKTLSPTTLTTTLTGLTSGTAHTFTVAATNAFGTAVASPASAAVVPYGGVTQPPAGLTRVQGSNRVMTAVATSRQLFPGAGSARAVVVASSTSFADSLAGARLASAVGAPLLLTDPLALNTEVAAEIGRVLAVPPTTTASTTTSTTLAAEAAGAAKPTTTGTVYLLGGTTAVSGDVETAVKAVNAKYAVTRISGADRYETATKIAAQVAVDDPVAGAPLYVASGRDYPDGLAVAALAARTGGVVLLTDGPTMPAATLTYLQKYDPNSELLVAVGGPAAKATTGHGADRAVVGADRYDTARRVAERFTAPAGSARVTAVGLATGDNWPDALAGAAAMGNLRGPLLLTPSASLSGSVGPAVAAASSAGRPSSALVFGGPTVVSASTATAFGALVSG